MPITIPTADEITTMPWHTRRKVITALRGILAELQEAYEPPDRRLWEYTDPKWVQGTQDEARRLLAAMPADPEAASHRRAVGGRDA